MSGRLRHGLNCLWPSEIADQFYCEYKVHLRRLHPEIRVDLASLELGEASHVALTSQATPISRDEIERSAQDGKKLAVCEWTLEARFQGVLIRGQPDYFAFEGKKAILLLDFKFSTATKPFRGHEVQAATYAVLAECLGYETADLCYGIVLLPRAGPQRGLDDDALPKTALLQSANEDGILDRISQVCEQARERLLASNRKTTSVETDCWKLFLFRYDPKQAAKDLAWALGYWLQQREPVPVKRWPNKCRVCALKAAGLCEHALREPDSSFNVARQTNGQVFVFRGAEPDSPHAMGTWTC